MPNYTPNLNLEKPLQTETYNIDVHNANSDKIDAASNEHRTAAVLDHPNGSVTEPKLAPEAVSTRALSKTGVAAGTYKSVTVDVKGRVSAGTNPTTLAGYGIKDAYPKSTSDARYLPIAGKAVDANSADKLNYKMIASGTDLNSLTSEGRYRCNTFATAGTLLNCPVQSAFFLDVALGSYQTQLLYTLRSEVYIRSYQTAEWGDWFRLVSSRELITSINGIATNGGAVDLSSVFLKLDGTNNCSLLRMSGNIAKSDTSHYLEVCGGSGYTSGAFLSLAGKDFTAAPYRFYLDSNGKRLQGNQDGTLTWCNKNIVRRVHGAYADSNGAVNIPNATQSQSGVMTPVDKAKLDGIEANANKYTLPPAGASVLGGIKVGANLGISNGVLSGAYTTATTSAAGLMPKLSGNANDVMTGTGAWWNRAWRRAYSGTFTTVGGVVCTLPANWVEVYLTASTFGSSGLENSGIYSKSDQGKELEYGRGQCELQFKINSNNQVVLNSIGAGGDGVVRGVYYR